jgi:hypothetical protein
MKDIREPAEYTRQNSAYESCTNEAERNDFKLPPPDRTVFVPIKSESGHGQPMEYRGPT